ncbi:MAG: hypothetical protein ABW185_05700 [Sedimenticola sp.]
MSENNKGQTHVSDKCVHKHKQTIPPTSKIKSTTDTTFIPKPDQHPTMAFAQQNPFSALQAPNMSSPVMNTVEHMNINTQYGITRATKHVLPNDVSPRYTHEPNSRTTFLGNGTYE